MVDVPAAIPVTTPALVIVATEVLLDTHGVVEAAVADPVNVVVEPTQTLVVPVMVGKAFTVNITELEAVEQPLDEVTIHWTLYPLYAEGALITCNVLLVEPDTIPTTSVILAQLVGLDAVEYCHW